MIMIDGKEYRNLEEQVLKNKEDIAKHYQAMQLPVNLAGIEVIGSITDPSELDGVIGEKFGDAYVQVVGEDTYLWIWTRANPDAGEDEAYWLNIPFTTVGEQGAPGPAGPQGPQGNRGSLWYVGAAAPNVYPQLYRSGDMYLNYTTGNVYRYKASSAGSYTWEPAGNIKGPKGSTGPRGEQGPQGRQGPLGPQGPRGQAGAAVLIAGILTSVDQLPTYADIQNPNLAYLVGTEAPYILWIQEAYRFSHGDVVDTRWVNVGEFGAGTTVFVGGEPVSTFDADTKLSIPDNIGDYPADCVISIKRGNPGPIPVPLCHAPEDGAIPTWNENGTIQTKAPQGDNDCVNMKYMYDRNCTVIGHEVHLIMYNQSDESERVLTYKTITNIDEPLTSHGIHETLELYRFLLNYPLVDEATGQIVIMESVEQSEDDEETFIVKLRGENYNYHAAFDDTGDNYYYIYEP